MPRTPDRFPGPREDEAVLLEEQALEPETGEIRNVAGALKAADAQGVFELRGITRAEHQVLDTLVHRLAESAHLEVVRDASGRTTAVVTWTDATRTTRVREELIARDAQGRLIRLTESQYNDDGQLGASLTTTFTRDSAGRVRSADLVEA